MANPRAPSQRAKDKRYFAILGEFYHSYTDVEHSLNMLIRFVAFNHVADTTTGKSRAVIAAITGAMRMSPAKDTVKRLLRALKVGKPTIDYANAVFSQLGEIQWLRDRLAHHWTILDHEEGYLNFDFVTSREPEKSEDVTFQLPALENAVEDLTAISGAVHELMSRMTRGGEEMEKIAVPGWHYKPSQIARNRPKLTDTRE